MFDGDVGKVCDCGNWSNPRWAFKGFCCSCCWPNSSCGWTVVCCGKGVGWAKDVDEETGCRDEVGAEKGVEGEAVGEFTAGWKKKLSDAVLD